MLQGDVALIGAYHDTENGAQAGAAYYFRFDGSIWVEEQKILPSDGAAEDDFGLNIALDGNVAVISADLHDGAAKDAGAAYIFRFDGSQWVEEQKLIPKDIAPNMRFGQSVDAFGDTVVVGTSESAYVFRFDNGEWFQSLKLFPTVGARSFGHRIAVRAGQALVGAEDDANNAGSVLIFDVNTTGCCIVADLDGDFVIGIGDFLLLLAQWGPCPPNCIADLDGDGSVGILDFLYLLSVWGPCP